jgi:NADH-quinone oxidoreductase subunit K
MEAKVCLLISALLFSLGTFGVMTRRNAIGILISIELMFNAANLNMITFSSILGDPCGQALAIFGIAITAAEVVLGFGIAVLLFRTRRTVNADEVRLLKG